jgi:hypothetical protein
VSSSRRHVLSGAAGRYWVLTAGGLGALSGLCVLAFDALRSSAASVLGEGLAGLLEGVAVLPAVVPAAFVRNPGALLVGLLAGQAVRFAGMDVSTFSLALLQAAIAAAPPEIWLAARRDRAPLTLAVAGALTALTGALAALALTPNAVVGPPAPLASSAALGGAAFGWVVGKAAAWATALTAKRTSLPGLSTGD